MFAMDVLQVLIVADDPLVRAGLAGLLADLTTCEVAGQMSSQGLLAELDEGERYAELFQVVLWDAGWELPEFLPEWRELGLPVVALLPETDDVLRVWASGVAGVLSREVDAESLVAALHTAVTGLIVLDAVFAPLLFPPSEELLLSETAVDLLTEREREVLQLVAEGLTNKAIAWQLHISDHTVKFHVNAIMTKLGSQSRTEAVVQATRLGLIIL